MTYEKIDFQHYYDGHYEDSGLSPEEREKAAEEARKENKKYKDWSEIDH